MIHHLKIKKVYADAICAGVKPFEVRREDDKHFDVGDVITFEVIDRIEHHDIEKRSYFVPYVLRHEDFPEGVPEGYCIFTISQLPDELSYYYTREMYR